MLTYDLEGRGKLSRYEYLYRCIRADIERGVIAAGGRLPSKRALAAHLGVSVITVEQAYDQLVAEGYIFPKPRSGYFASDLVKVERPAGEAGRALSEREPASASISEPISAPDSEPASPAVPVVADFAHGAPFNERAFDLWARALRRTAASENPAEAFGDLPAKGHPRLRRAIARYLEGSRGMAADPRDIVVGAGSQLLYGLVVQLLGRDGAYAVEDPGYPALTGIYRAQGAEVRHIPLDGQGISVAALERSGARVAHVMPSHQYPTGIVTGIARRRELLAWAEGERGAEGVGGAGRGGGDGDGEGVDGAGKSGGDGEGIGGSGESGTEGYAGGRACGGRYIVEDDYDCELRLAGRPVPALAGIDGAGRVIYLNTFARSISPTLRVAYMVLPPQLSARFDDELGFYSNTVSAFAQVALARLIEDGSYERSVNRLRTAHRAQRGRLAAAVRSVASAQEMRLEQADSGLHCVLAIATDRDERDIAAACREQGVLITSLSGFCADEANYRAFAAAQGTAPTARFLLDYAGASDAQLRDALAIIARVR